MFHYGYFVRLLDGKLVPAGDDWGQTKDSYRIGQSLGVKNGTEGIVIGVHRPKAKGQQRFDVVVIVEQRAAAGNAARCGSGAPASPVVTTMPGHPPPLPGPPTIQTALAEGQRAIAIWQSIVFRPLTETFHEFLVEVPLKGTFGESWYKREIAKREDRQHIVVRWLAAFRSQASKYKPAGHQKGQVFAGPATGEGIELMALAHDLYLLQKVNRLPKKLVNRLRNYDEFQGARYEVAIASAFVKCGFEIEWITDSSGPHPEFVARNPHSHEDVAVETKSRHRSGALHQPGKQTDQLTADVDQLYSDALHQNPGDRPFAVFLDVNVPPGRAPENLADWQAEIMARWQGDPNVSLIGFTNFAWHYQKGEQTGTKPREYILAASDGVTRPLKSSETVGCLQIAFDTYGVCANEY
jgi:hypothetical protein